VCTRSTWSRATQRMRNVILTRDDSDPARNVLLRKLYDAHVLEVDNYVRRSFVRLEELGVLENTVVIITSDHGDEFGEHGGLSHDGKWKTCA